MDVESKQLYLRENIIDKGYSPEEFINYFMKIKSSDNTDNDDFDLDLISYEELVQIVKDFIDIKLNTDNDIKNKPKNSLKVALLSSRKSSIEHNSQDIDNISIDSKNRSTSCLRNVLLEAKEEHDKQVIFHNSNDENINIGKHDEENSNKIQEEIKITKDSRPIKSIKSPFKEMQYCYNDEMDCNEMLMCEKMEKTPLFNVDKLAITISKPKKIGTGIFSSGELAFNVICKELNIQVERREKDIEILNLELAKQFPCYYIPPIPFKKFMESHNHDIVFKKIRAYQNFIDHITFIPILRSSNIFYDFLTIKSYKELDKIYETYSKTTNILKLKDIKNTEGILYSKVNQDILNKHELANSYVTNTKTLLSELIATYNELQKNLENISNTYNKLSNISSKLKDVSIKYSDPVVITKTYSFLSELNKTWSQCYSKQISLIETEFKEFFGFYSDELDHFQTQNFSFQKAKDDYIRTFVNLKNKKEKLFRYYSVGKWELDKKLISNETDIIDINTKVLSNKEEAFKIMCKNESDILEEKKNKFGVFCYHSLDDYFKLKNHHSYRFKNHIISLSERNNDLLGDAFTLVKLIHMNASNISNTITDNIVDNINIMDSI